METVERFVSLCLPCKIPFLKGAVVLHSDPSCWDDVLLPARLVKISLVALKLAAL